MTGKLLPILAALLIATCLGGCATKTVNESETPMPLMTSADPIDETYVDVVEQFTFRPSFTGYTFPVGRYLPVKRENGGLFYESPFGIRVRTLGGSYVARGGIFRGDPNARNDSDFRVYVYMAGELQMLHLHSMIGLDLNKKVRCAPPLKF